MAAEAATTIVSSRSDRLLVNSLTSKQNSSLLANASASLGNNSQLRFFLDLGMQIFPPLATARGANKKLGVCPYLLENDETNGTKDQPKNTEPWKRERVSVLGLRGVGSIALYTRLQSARARRAQGTE